jgi:hypothetical protein
MFDATLADFAALDRLRLRVPVVNPDGVLLGAVESNAAAKPATTPDEERWCRRRARSAPRPASTTPGSSCARIGSIMSSSRRQRCAHWPSRRGELPAVV